METELLIDGDLYAFSTSIALQKENPFVEGEFEFDEDLGATVLKGRIEEQVKKWNADKVTIALSCPREENFRLTQVCDSYKHNRKESKKPIGLSSMRTVLEENYDVITEPCLEADDLLGLMATNPNRNSRRIVISWDKDVTALEGETYNPQKDVYKKVSKQVSIRFFLYQCLIGDSADGYKGIKRIGPKKAKPFIAGLNPLSIAWEKIVELAERQGHGEKEEAEAWMLTQARMAWILRDEDYDWENKKVRLWTPERINDYL